MVTWPCMEEWRSIEASNSTIEFKVRVNTDIIGSLAFAASD